MDLGQLNTYKTKQNHNTNTKKYSDKILFAMSNDKIRLLFYAGGGILSFVIMLKILDMLVKKAGKKIEDDVLMEMQSKGEYVPEKTDKIVECATMLGYMSPFLCVSTWISGIENTQIYKWGIIILVHILGIGIPLLVKKKKQNIHMYY